jgi:hypothetical protein
MIALGVLVVLAPPVLALVALILAVDARQRRRAEIVARQIEVTDAIHREFGAVVAPFVRRTRRGWRVRLPMEPWHPDAARLVALAAHTLERDGEVEVSVVTPASPRPPRPTRQNRERMASAMSA